MIEDRWKEKHAFDAKGRQNTAVKVLFNFDFT